MTLPELTATVGTEITVRTDLGPVRVLVVDVKQSYGRSRFLVRTMEGAAPVWINEERVQVGK